MFNNQKGWTLVELICVMVMMANLFAIVWKKSNEIHIHATYVVASDTLAKVNTNELVGWTVAKFSDCQPNNIDACARKDINYFLGDKQMIVDDKVLIIRDLEVPVIRIPATTSAPARWELRL